MLLEGHSSRQHLGSKPEPHRKVAFSVVACPTHDAVPLSTANEAHYLESEHPCFPFRCFLSLLGDLEQRGGRIPVWKALVRIAWKSQGG